jgi:hypothetical protein
MNGDVNTTADVNQPVKKAFGAKNLSKGSIVFACIWVAVLTILKGMGKINLDQSEIIGSAAAMVMFWSPTYLSVYMDKRYAAKGGGA